MTENPIEPRAFSLADGIEYAPGAVVSKTLLDRKVGTLTLFAFAAGQGLSEHTSPYAATVYVLEGTAELVVGGEPLRAAAGEMVILPPGVAHEVRAREDFKMLLIMIRG